MPRSLRAAIVSGALAVAVAGCSGDASSSSDASTSQSTPTSALQPLSTTDEVARSTSGPVGAELPIIEQIDEAVAALDTELSGAQSFFEINATARLVNMFVALNNGAVAQPWVYLDGTLTSSEGQPASGGSFEIAAVDFDPEVILSTVLTDLPDITIETFYIHGDGQGHVLYGVLATTSKGGGLDVILGADGAVKSVDPVN